MEVNPDKENEVGLLTSDELKQAVQSKDAKSDASISPDKVNEKTNNKSDAGQGGGDDGLSTEQMPVQTLSQFPQPLILVPIGGIQGDNKIPQIFVPLALSQANQVIPPGFPNVAIKPMFTEKSVVDKQKAVVENEDEAEKLSLGKRPSSPTSPQESVSKKMRHKEPTSGSSTDVGAKDPHQVEIIVPDTLTPKGQDHLTEDIGVEVSDSQGDRDIEVDVLGVNVIKSSLKGHTKEKDIGKIVVEKRNVTECAKGSASSKDKSSVITSCQSTISTSSSVRSVSSAEQADSLSIPNCPVLLKNISPPVLGNGINPAFSIEVENLKHEIRALKLKVQIQKDQVSKSNKSMAARENEIRRLHKSLCTAKDRLVCAKSKETILRTKLKEDKLEIRRLKSKKTRMESAMEYLRESGQTEAQIRQVLHPERKFRKNYSKKDLVVGAGLKNISGKAYEFARKYGKLAVPSQQQLMSSIGQLGADDGFQTAAMTAIKNKFADHDQETIEHHVVLSFGERQLTTSLVSKPVQKKVLVVMAVGLISTWKQPIYFKFNESMSKALLMEIIGQCVEANLVVRGVVCDLENQTVITELNLLKQPWFPDPVCAERKIYYMPDVPDLLTRLRNHVFTDGLLINSWRQTTFDFVTLVKGDFLPLVPSDNDAQQLCPKLRDKHVNHRIIGREDVGLAAQILSSSTASAIRQKNKTNLRKVFKAETIEIIDKWFDVFNSRKDEDAKLERCAFGINSESQLKALEDMDVLVNNLSIINHSTNRTLHSGILAANSSLRELHLAVAEQGTPHLVTRRLSLDLVENFVSKIKDFGKIENPK